jgi:hypothetical protein
MTEGNCVSMSAEFSYHALEKMRSRYARISDVIATLTSPDEVYEDVGHETLVAVKKINARSIIVVYREEDGVAKVITLYYTTKLDRFIRAKMVRGAWKKTK